MKPEEEIRDSLRFAELTRSKRRMEHGGQTAGWTGSDLRGGPLVDESHRSRQLNDFKSKVESLSAEELLALSAVLARSVHEVNEESKIVAARIARLKASQSTGTPH